MKRFSFPLDRVLRYRHLQVEAEEARLEAQLAQVRQIDDRLAGLENEASNTADQIRPTLTATSEVMLPALAAYPAFRLLLARERHGLQLARRQAMEAVDRQRAAVVEARRACEILERARSLAHDLWQAQHLREQEALAGELYLSKWRRRRSGN